MDVPGVVQSALDGESVAADVSLTGEDAVFVTPTRTLVYRGEGLLSDESVEEFPHDAERLELSEGRRKAAVRFDYGLEGERELAVPTGRVDDVLHPLLAGVLNASAVTEAGETIRNTYRFSELTLVVTSARVVKHVGTAVWDEEYDEVPYEAVTGIQSEEGSVSSQLVLEMGARTERIKTPNEQARAVKEAVEEALFASHGASDRAAFERAVAPEDEEDTGGDDGGDVTFEESLDPIESSPPESGGAETVTAADDGFAESAFETATARSEAPDLAAELEALSEAVRHQRELLDAQEAAIERLADRLDER